MRVVVIVVWMLALAAPSHASNSCMTKTEARQHFGSVHIYWHGPDHCWDATPIRNRQVRSTKINHDRQVQRGRKHSDWRQAMSEMSPDDEPVQTPGVRTTSGAAAAHWSDRWVNIVPVAPRPIAERMSEPKVASPALAHDSESTVTPRVVVVLAFLACVLTLATIEVLFRNDERQG